MANRKLNPDECYIRSKVSGITYRITVLRRHAAKHPYYSVTYMILHDCINTVHVFAGSHYRFVHTPALIRDLKLLEQCHER